MYMKKEHLLQVRPGQENAVQLLLLPLPLLPPLTLSSPCSSSSLSSLSPLSPSGRRQGTRRAARDQEQGVLLLIILIILIILIFFLLLLPLPQAPVILCELLFNGQMSK